MKISKILISQPEPADIEQSQYRALVKDYHLDLTFYKFFEVEGISVSEFRKTRIHFSDYSAIIFNSRHAVDHFFRMAKELRETIPDTMKYFCVTESIAYYLQNYVQFRKRKIFFGSQFFADLIDVLAKHREENFLFPCSDEKQTEYTKLLDKAKFRYKKAPIYRSVPRDLSQFNIKDYDLVCLFSPIGVRSLLKNFPHFKDNPIPVAAFGAATHTALNQAGIKLTIAAPTKSAPSMAMAIQNFLDGKQQEAVIIARPTTIKSRTRSTRASVASTTSSAIAPTSSRKVKSVFTNKAKYKQLMEEKRAKAAARKADRERRKAEAAAQEKAENTSTTATKATRTRKTTATKAK